MKSSHTFPNKLVTFSKDKDIRGYKFVNNDFYMRELFQLKQN